jgi:hypothetical protein
MSNELTEGITSSGISTGCPYRTPFGNTLFLSQALSKPKLILLILAFA